MVVSRELLKLSFPILLSNWIYALQGFVVLMAVSGLGEEIIAGVGFGSTLIWLLYGIDEAAYTGIAVLTAERLKEGERAGRLVVYAALTALGISVAPLLVGEEAVFKFLSLFGVKGEALKGAVEYAKPVFLLSPLILLTNNLNAVLNGAGRTKEIFYGTALVFLLNLVLLKTLVPKMGALGAGYSVSISESAASLLYAYYCLKDERLTPFKDLKVKLGEMKELLKVGAPASLEEIVSSLSFNLFTGLVATCGTEALAAFQVGIKVEGIGSSVGFSLLDAAIPFIGRAKEGIKERLRELKKSSLILGSLVGVVLIEGSRLWTELFNLKGEIKELTEVYLLFAGLSQPFFTLSLALTGALRALKRTEVEVSVNLGSFWLLRIVPSYALLKVLKSPLVPWSFSLVESVLKSLILKKLVERFTRGAL
ncbi:MATE family efflux transporter [Thermovibrio sp.]